MNRRKLASALVRLIAVAAGISLLFVIAMASLTSVNAEPATAPSTAPTSVDPAPCYATPNDGVTVFNTVDSRAVQMAVDALQPLSDTVTVWGVCNGVSERAGIDQALYISRSVHIVGDAGQEAVIDAGGAGRVIVVDGGSVGDMEVTLANLDVESGSASGQNGPTPGGNDNGGGMLVHNADVTLKDVRMTGNSGVYGGAVYISGTLTVSAGTVISGNTAALGAGVYNSAGRLTVDSSVVFGNQAQNGGGVFNTDTGMFALVNSTLSQNSATQRGGNIRNEGMLTVTNSTLAHGSAVTDGGGIHSSGGEVRLANSVLAGNSGGDCVRSTGVVSATSTLLSDAGAEACGLMDGVNGNITGADPLLDPLADNGGTTLTYAFPYTSPLHDAGDVSLAVDGDGQPLLFDQRGDGYPRVVGASVDLGAYESSFAQTITVVKALSPTIDSGRFVMMVDGVSGVEAGDGAIVTATVQVSDTAHFSETAGAETDLTDYVTTWRCDDPAATSGAGITGSLTMPAVDVTCVVTNTLIPPTTGSITGTVVSTDSTPLFGVTVTADNATAAVDVGEVLSTTTDLDGEYVLEEVAPGATQLIFEKLGYMPNAVNVTVTVGLVTHAPTVTLSAREAVKPSAVFVPEARTAATQ